MRQKANGTDELLNPAALLAEVDRASSREQAIAHINEFVSEVSRQLERGVRVPSALGRVCFASGTLFALLALIKQLSESVLMVTPALLSLGAGLASGLVCLELGRAANKRRKALRQAAEALRHKLEQRLAPARVGEP